MAIPKPRVRYDRPEVLSSKTYRFKPQSAEHHWYITISDGTIDDVLRPVEIFIQSKEMNELHWISALARMVSAQLQQPGQFPMFVVEELKQTYDAMGGYFVPKGTVAANSGQRAASIVAHIGMILEQHCKGLKLL